MTRDQPEALVGTRHRDRRACLPGWRARALRSESGFPGKPGRPVGPGLRVRWPGNPGLRPAQPRRTDVLFMFPAIPSRSCAGLQVTQWYRDSG